MKTKLIKVYNELFSEYGPQGWWPIINPKTLVCEYNGGPRTNDEKFEVMIGAILTQNSVWNPNVVKSLINLSKKNLLNAQNIVEADKKLLSDSIKSSGYFNQKTKKLKILARFILENKIKELDRMKKDILKKKFLSLWGIGDETADSILLYALNKPIIVIDTYTKRILSRMGLINFKKSYNEFQEFIKTNFYDETYKLQELHALLVEHAKLYCAKNNPDCWMCPIYEHCKRNIN